MRINLRGFTIIELLVVIVIISVLSAFVIVPFTGAQKQSRDARRKSDVGQYRTALEQFANNNAMAYPSRTTTVSADGSLCTDLGSNLASCPQDPRESADSSFDYKYQSNGSGNGTVDATNYVLWAKLEATADNWVLCSNGKAGTKAQTGFAVTGGACPL